MTFGPIRAILLFMIFIMEYISRFLPREEEEPEEDDKGKKAHEVLLFGRVFPLF